MVTSEERYWSPLGSRGGNSGQKRYFFWPPDSAMKELFDRLNTFGGCLKKGKNPIFISEIFVAKIATISQKGEVLA